MLNRVEGNSGNRIINNLLGWAALSLLGLSQTAESWKEATKKCRTLANLRREGKPSFVLLPDSTLLPCASCRAREQRCTRFPQAQWAIVLCIPGKAVSSASALHWHFPPNSPNLLLRHCSLYAEPRGQMQKAACITLHTHHLWPKPTGQILSNA